jgi:hypothetical protein
MKPKYEIPKDVFLYRNYRADGLVTNGHFIVPKDRVTKKAIRPAAFKFSVVIDDPEKVRKLYDKEMAQTEKHALYEKTERVHRYWSAEKAVVFASKGKGKVYVNAIYCDVFKLEKVLHVPNSKVCIMLDGEDDPLGVLAIMARPGESE